MKQTVFIFMTDMCYKTFTIWNTADVCLFIRVNYLWNNLV